MKIGLPSGFQQTFVAIGMIALYGIVNAYGTDVVAAFAVAGRIDFFAMMPAMNFSQALSTFVGQNIGANKIERVRKGLLTTWLSTSAITLVISIVVLSLSNELMSVFTKDPAVISIGADYLIIASSFYLVFTSMFVINGVMRGAGETLVPMMITLFALWFVRLPASWLLSGEYGVIGIWWGIPAGWIVGALASFLYYLSGRWKTKGVVRHRV